jgi:AGCS family alanine or glycine:cation symporter
MWVQGIIGISYKFYESFYTCKTKEINLNKEYYGGSHKYISIYNKKISIIYTIILFISMTTIGIMIQTNSIMLIIKDNININKLIFALLLIFSVYLICKKGIINTINIINKILPLITILYFIFSIYIILLNIDKIQIILSTIIKDAFNFKSLSGYTIFQTIKYGFMRGLFSNEAGIGSGSLSFGCSHNLNPYKEGLISSLNPIVDTLIFCTLTAFVILSSEFVIINDSIFYTNIKGSLIINQIYRYVFPNIGIIFISISIFIFGLASILGTYIYGEISLKYLNISNKYYLKYIFIFILLGTFFNSKILWNLIDYFNIILLSINTYYLLKIIRNDNK